MNRERLGRGAEQLHLRFYGKPTKTGSLGNEFDFAGQQTDATGLHYLRARNMDHESPGAYELLPA